MTVRYIAGLTKLDLEAIGHACRGLQNKEIACKMNVSCSTVKFRLVGIYKRLRISSRYELYIWAMGNGLFKTDEIERDILGNRKEEGKCTVHQIGL